MVFKLTNPTIKLVVKEFYKNVPVIVNFEDKCNEFLNYLDKLPKEFDINAISLY